MSLGCGEALLIVCPCMTLRPRSRSHHTSLRPSQNYNIGNILGSKSKSKFLPFKATVWPLPWFKGHPRSYDCQGLPMPTFNQSFMTLMQIVSQDIANVKVFWGTDGVTLTLVSKSRDFEGLPTAYLWPKFHYSTVNGAQDIASLIVFWRVEGRMVWPWPWSQGHAWTHD